MINVSIEPNLQLHTSRTRKQPKVGGASSIPAVGARGSGTGKSFLEAKRDKTQSANEVIHL